MQQRNRSGATRRDVLRSGARIALAVPFAGVASSGLLAGCGSGDEPAAKPATNAPATPAPKPAPTPAAPPAAVEPTPTPPPAPEPAAGGGGAGAGELVTDKPESAPLVAALQYTHESQTPGQNCEGCQLYTASSEGLGKCQLIPAGYVKASGWCASWAAKVV
jgi:hypothetical protein